jgi:hypothetical protein
VAFDVYPSTFAWLTEERPNISYHREQMRNCIQRRFSTEEARGRGMQPLSKSRTKQLTGSRLYLSSSMKMDVYK